MINPRKNTTMAPSFAPSQHGEEGGSRRRFVIKGHWKSSEDVKLRELVALHGPKNWNMISEQLPGRTGKSCRLRWVNQLDPQIKTTVFSKQEDETLMAAHIVFGNKWSHIAKFFPGRTDNGVKNHWHVLTSRRRKHVAENNNSSSSSSSSFGSFHRGSDDSTNGSYGSTITHMGRSNVINEGISLLGMTTPDSVFETETRAVEGGRYCNNKMVTNGCYIMGTGTSVSPDASLSLVYPPENSNSYSPPPFIDFLGIGH